MLSLLLSTRLLHLINPYIHDTNTTIHRGRDSGRVEICYTVGMANRDYMRNPQHWIQLTPKLSVAYITTKDYTVHKAKIDPIDVETVGKYRWYMKDGYAVTSIQYKRVKMHHLIMGKPPKGKQVDHIDRDRLNNTRNNLRLVSAQQNHFNTDFKGVRQRGKRWTAQIQRDGKIKHLGTYDTEEVARQAYLQAKETYHVIN